MIVGTLLATGLSALCIVSLCLGDPKRMRTSGLTGTAASVRVRIAVTLAALFPGIALALMGDAPAFLVWLGACAVAGWFTTIWLSSSKRSVGRHGQRQ